MAIEHFIKYILSQSGDLWEVAHYESLDSREGSVLKAEEVLSVRLWHLILENLPPRFSFLLEGLYSHQIEALRRLKEGKHVVVSTPMASGKSLIYYLFFAEKLLEDPSSKAIFTFPIKALSRDQLEKAKNFFGSLFPSIRISVYDGDTLPKERAKIRESVPEIIITNPDMIHLAFLPYHAKWQRLWENLKLLVIDEVHTYRGILGSHVSQILRRLRRIHNHYNPEGKLQFVFLSATIGNPEELSTQLSGLPEEEIVSIKESSSPLPKRHFLFLKTELPLTVVSSWLLKEAVQRNLRTIVFTRSRKTTELIHLGIKRRFPEISKYISSYRAGLLPSDRRDIEKRLAENGDLRGVISTSAMELGIDIGNLDVCILVGYPGTIMNTWQRAGRVGRSGRDSLVILLPQRDALDQYIVSHPEHVLYGKPEIAVADYKNKEILKAHLLCACFEKPIEPEELIENPHWHKNLRVLRASGEVFQDEEGKYYSILFYPHRFVDIRKAGSSFLIFERSKGSIQQIGFVSGSKAFKECHPGAIYLHLGETYRVLEIDLERGNILIEPFDGHYFTVPRSEKETAILEVLEERHLENYSLKLARLKITEQVIGYEKKSTKSLETIGFEELNLPPQSYETVGFWIEIEDWIKEFLQRKGLHFMGGIHALEHALISLFPLFILCDRGDIGGIAYPIHPQIGKGAVFIYDGYEGGIGISEKAFEIFERLLEKVKELLESCECPNGCPSCIHSPKCGSGNKPLDKEAVKEIVRLILYEKGKKSSNSEGAQVIYNKLKPPSPRVGFLDLETQFLSHEVGGWKNKHLMKVSVAVLYDEGLSDFLIYKESQVMELVEKLKTYELLVGFNIIDFDYVVLSSYTNFDFSKLNTLDILKEFRAVTGIRVSLDHLCALNLGETKSADGFQAVRWYREGNWKELIDYCCKDVMLTRKLFYKILEDGFVFYNSRRKLKKAVINWTIEGLLKGESFRNGKGNKDLLQSNGSRGMWHNRQSRRW